MAMVHVNGTNLFYQEFGRGDETIVFSHGYLMNHKMFQAQIDALKDRYRVIAYDHRGHGQSENATEGYDIYSLMADGVELIEKLVDGPVHFMGMSTGGYVALRMMVRRPDLLKSVVLMDTAADAEPPEELKQYDLMLMVVRFLGVRPIFNRSISMLMGEKFRTDPARKEEYDYWRKYILGLNRGSLYRFGKGIFYRDSVLEEIQGNSIPALVIVGDKDIPTPPDQSGRIVDALENAQLVVIPDAGHTSPTEEPAAVTAAIEQFLHELS